MTTRLATITVAAVAAIAVAGCSSQKPAPAPAPAQPAPNAGRGGFPPGFPNMPTPGQDTTGRGGLGALAGLGAPAQPRPYNTVIRPGPGTITKRGMFVVHRVNERVYFEIPSKELNKDGWWSGGSRARRRAIRRRVRGRRASDNTPATSSDIVRCGGNATETA